METAVSMEMRLYKTAVPLIATPTFCTEKGCHDWAVQVFQAIIVAQ